MTLSYVLGSLRVLRGGSWDYGPQLARVAYRNFSTPDHRNRGLGLRVVRRCL